MRSPITSFPFEKLVEELQPERDPVANPLFQVSFSAFLSGHPRARRGSASDGGEDHRSTAAPRSSTWRSISGKARDEINGQIEYTTDLFDAATIERLAAHYKTLLKNAVASPAARLSELQILSDAEQHQLLQPGTGTPCRCPTSRSTNPVEALGADDTDRLGGFGPPDTAHSYDALNRRANRIAHRLRGLGVGPAARLSRSAWSGGASLIAAMLAILKTGARLSSRSTPPIHLSACPSCCRTAAQGSSCPMPKRWTGCRATRRC